MLSIAVSDATNIIGFGGTISLDGITSVQVANFNNDPDQQNFLLSDSSNIVLVGPSDTGTLPGGAIAGSTATIDAALGITGFQQSALSGAAGFRTLRTQFTATAVPEPSSFALLGGALACFTMRRRRTKAAA